jgi:hypothetical protein
MNSKIKIKLKSLPIPLKSLPIPLKSLPIPLKSLPIPLKSLPIPLKSLPNYSPPTLTVNDAQHMLDHGYLVLPVFNSIELQHYHSELESEMTKFPEYSKNSRHATVYVAGGFGAFGNPSAFHNPTVRIIRLTTMTYIIQLVKFLNEIQKRPTRKLEQLIDRLSFRRKGTTTTAESWHRDQASLPSPDDDIFGGWINFDLNENQYFSCVPGTHFDAKGQSGFAPLTPNDLEIAKKYKAKNNPIAIPPGHHILFYQNIIHEVVSKKMTYSALRLYTGYRLTDLTESLYSKTNAKLFLSAQFREAYKQFDFESIIDDQGLPPLPGGGVPPMYAKMNLVFPKQRYPLVEWSKETFQPQCLEVVEIKGEKLTLVNRFMKSLREYGLLMYPPYSDQERSILHPANY